MKVIQNATDTYVLQEIGIRLARARLEKNLTQAQLAEQAGIAKRTVERLEKGNNATHMTAFIRVCRILGFFERLLTLIPETPPSPIEQLKLQGRQRRRATGKRGGAIPPNRGAYTQPENDATQFQVNEDPPTAWKWGEDK